jgi:hypothetical protein
MNRKTDKPMVRPSTAKRILAMKPTIAIRFCPIEDKNQEHRLYAAVDALLSELVRREMSRWDQP